MTVFEKAMKSHNVLENDPYDWEKCDSEDMLTIAGTATTKQLTRLTPAYMGYLQPKKAFFLPITQAIHSVQTTLLIAVVSLILFLQFPSHSGGHEFNFTALQLRLFETRNLHSQRSL